MSLAIDPTTGLYTTGLTDPAPATLSGGAGATGSTSFGSLVLRAVDAVEQSQKGAEVEIARAVTGEAPDIHRTVIALQQADLQFQLGLQMRNKLIGAYDEIMKMQV